MYAYATSSAQAAQLSDFEQPPEVANSSGLARQTNAVSAAAAANPAQSVVPDVLARLESVPNPLADLVASFNGTQIDKYLSANTVLDDLVMLYGKYIVPYVSTAQSSIQSIQSFGQVSNGVTSMATFAKGLAPAVKAAEGAAQAAGSASTAGAGGVAAGLGRALPLGALSVPPSWAPVNAVTNPLGALNATVVPAGAEGVNALPMTPPFGQLAGNRYGRMLPTYGFKPSVMAKPPAAG